MVAFHGTGAFDPRVAPAMLRLRDWPRKLPDRSFAGLARLGHGDALGEQPVFSVVLAGPLTWMLKKPALAPGGFAWRSFPSEEVEVLGGVENALETIARDGLREALTIERIPPAQRAAGNFLLGTLTRARSEGLTPRVVVVGHSSGGRAAVRFVETMRGYKDPRTGQEPVMVDLAITLDPVREAHRAAQDILQGGVASEAAPEVLYKPENARRWVSFFQTTDSRSLGTGPVRVGIHGSPVEGADREYRITLEDPDLAAGAHMSIHRSANLRRVVEEELTALARRRPARRAVRLTPGLRAAAFYRSFLADAAPGSEGELVGGHNDFLYGLEAGARVDPKGFGALDLGLSGGREQGRLKTLLVRWQGFRHLEGAARRRAVRALAASAAQVRGDLAEALRRLREREARSRS